MTTLVEHNLTALAEMIGKREVSPVEVAEAHLKQIEKVNPQLNAIVTLNPDLLDQARRAEQSLTEGRVVGPLHGLPLTIKDTIETAGLRSTSGCRMRADYVPARDAPAVARLKQAGAIILGKTNPAEMAMDYTADNPVFGRTNNPYDVSKTPGGSSGGEAAAIATGMSPGGLGSDLAGSIRIPSHFCGISGLKPSTGRVPGEGQFPPSTGPYSLGAVIGPMARSVDDLELLFNVLTAQHSVEHSLGHCRVACYSDDGITPVTDSTRATVESAASVLSSAGLTVERTRPPSVEQGHDLWLKLFSQTSVLQLRNVYQGHENLAGPFVRWRLETANKSSPLSLDEYIQTWMERDRLRETLLRWMETVPLIVCPVGATYAWPHDTLKCEVGGMTIGAFRAFSYAQTFNVFDLPSVSIPVTRSSDGLPIGVQVVGPPAGEHLVLAAARILEKELKESFTPADNSN